MKEVEKYELVSYANSVKTLQSAILSIADKEGYIQKSDNGQKHNAGVMSAVVILVVTGESSADALPRAYGIRQQALYLKHYIERGLIDV